MRNEYTTTEAFEIGEAQAVILGPKPGIFMDVSGERSDPDSDFDE